MVDRLITAKEYEIKSYEVNANNEIKPYVLLHHLEDVAYRSANNLGFGYKDVYPQGYGWFLIKYNIEFKRLPQAWDIIGIKTWPANQKGIQCRREFEITDSKGETIGAASSLWVLIDLNSMKIVNAKKVLNYPELPDKFALDTNFEKILPIENANFETTLSPSFEDIDLNNHVNNANYINWAIKALNYDYLINRTIKGIKINYKHEIKYGDEIICKTKFDNNNNTTTHSFYDKNTNEACADIQIQWALK